MNSDRPRYFSGLLPVLAALVIIFGFSFLVYLRSGKKPVQESPAQAEQVASPVAIEHAVHVCTLDLVGVVKGVDGQPVPNASVFIYTARPRSGPGFL